LTAAGQSPGSAWITPIEVPLDRDGPVEVLFDPPPADFVEQRIHELFEIVAARHATAGALADGTGTPTYAEVRRTVALLAAEIATRVPGGNGVAVLLPNVSASIIGVLAVWAAETFITSQRILYRSV
jgi:non-ribosomal peptide synthetase component F